MTVVTLHPLLADGLRHLAATREPPGFAVVGWPPAVLVVSRVKRCVDGRRYEPSSTLHPGAAAIAARFSAFAEAVMKLLCNPPIQFSVGGPGGSPSRSVNSLRLMGTHVSCCIIHCMFVAWWISLCSSATIEASVTINGSLLL